MHLLICCDDKAYVYPRKCAKTNLNIVAKLKSNRLFLSASDWLCWKNLEIELKWAIGFVM